MIELLAQVSETPVIIIDGVYDTQLLLEIQQVWPAAVVQIIVVTAPYETAMTRMAQRLGIASAKKAMAEIELLDRAKESAGMEELIAQATFTCDNSGAVDDAKRQIMAHCGLNHDHSPDKR